MKTNIESQGEANFSIFEHQKSIDILKFSCKLHFLPFVIDYENQYATSPENRGEGNGKTSHHFRDEVCI
jgi:hypothetical protein